MNLNDMKAVITKLNNENYQTWKFRMELILTKDDLWDVTTQVQNDTKPEWLAKDRQAKVAISLLINDDQLIHIRRATTAKEMWDELKKVHERSNLTSKLYLLRKLYKTRLEKGTTMRAHVNNVLEMVDKIRGSGEDIKDSHTAALLLCSLPDTYDTLITALESRPESELTLEYVKGKLIDEWERREESQNEKHTKGQTETAFNVKSSYSKPKREGKRCYYCDKVGHFKKDCRFFKAEIKKNNQHAKLAEAKNIETPEKSTSNVEHENICFTARSNLETNKWYIDSGATCHMCNDKNFFSALSTLQNSENILLADGSCTKSEGIGSGHIICESLTNGEQKILLNEVLYVPNLKGNLLSVKALTKKGHEVEFKRNKCIIRSNNVEVAIAELDLNLYRLKCRNVNIAMLADNACKHENCINMWHKRFGHRDKAAIMKLNNEKLAEGIKIENCSNDGICDICIKGKMTRFPFPKVSNNRATIPFCTVHTDVCGPMNNETPGGMKYFIVFVDDFSRYTETYLMKHKNEAKDKIKEYLTKGNNRFNRKLVTLRTDGGGEFINRDIEEYLKTEGISRQITVPYSPEQNGISERKNRTLTEMTRCLLLEARLQNCYWGEAIMTATYLQNRLPHASCKKTPFELWHGKPPNIQHLRKFGSKVYTYIPKEQRKKLDDRAIEGIFVGYSSVSKGYRILRPSTNTIVISRSVLFDEDSNIETSTIFEKIEKKEEILDGDVKLNVIDAVQEKPIETTDDDEHNVNVRRSNRSNFGKPAERLSYVSINDTNPEPQSWMEILEMDTVNKQKWMDAIKIEMESLKKNKTWDLVQLPKGKKTVGCRWVFKRKLNAQGDVERYKARLVAKGYSQKFGEDFDAIFAPVVKHTTLRTMLTLAATREMKTCHIDINSAFLYANLNEDIYMDQPDGQLEAGKEDLVCKLNNCLYGLKQAAREWNVTLNDILLGHGFLRGTADKCLYSKTSTSANTYILVYVDDLLICSSDDNEIQDIKNVLEQSFEIKDLGEVKYYLGINIDKDSNGNYRIHQTGKIKELLIKHGMQDAKSAKTPMEVDYLKNNLQTENNLINNDHYRQAVGALLYLATTTRPDIALSTGLLGRKVSQPTQRDWEALKRVLRYLKATINMKLILGRENDIILRGYVDADWGGDIHDRKSTSGYLFTIGNSLISWTSRKQTCVAQSTTEAEYVAAAMACQELLWLKQLLKDMGYEQKCPIVLNEDNQSCIKLIVNEKASNRTKHIDIKYHLIRDLQEQEIIDIQYCETEIMLADILTKPLMATKFNLLLNGLNLKL